MDVLDDEGTLWVSTASGLLRLTGSGSGRYAAVPSARVNAIEADEDIPFTSRSATVPYGQTVRFRFAATAFQDPARTLYSTQLVGHDDVRSAWRDERFREYTNLSPGTYVFRVDALSAQGIRARPAVVTVTVPAPWYLSVWAAMLATLFAGLAVAAIAWSTSRHHRLRADGERLRADELDRLNAQLRHADELKDSMLANTSHELRTPLTAILGFSEILTDHDDEEVQELADHMLSAGNRLLHTVNDLLDVARLRSGKVDLSPVEVDVARVARRVVAELAPLASQKGLALAVVPAGLSVIAMLDPDAFARVVTNLVSNGIKFTDRGSVTVSIDASEGDVRLQVTDTGRGIDAEFLPRLFQTFEQESTGYGRSAEGSGLGMAITGQLVDLMGGTIAVESELNKGTTIRVRIPAEATTGPSDPHRVDAASVS
ncbi:hypothetical protein BSZ36_05865 [Rubricoccus marinus]|uniref:histidine kinase n=2 Tax=Rubricoccus marinus TaxID=716817 RepID=A0A259TXP4_9BACT|nr:hypothetical protein BSZ36_05865 [Rubricoccus marinus]